MTIPLEFDILGISVPNTVRDDVIVSMRHLVNKLGFPLLVIDETDWIKVVDAVLEQLELEDDTDELGQRE